jgi:hypothetical protein
VEERKNMGIDLTAVGREEIDKDAVSQKVEKT